MSKLKNLLAIAVISITALPAFAQAQEDSIVFNPHWNLQLQGGAGYTVGETSFSKLITPAAALSAEYKFNPVLGVRVGASGWEAKGAVSKGVSVYSFNYLQGNVDLTANLANWLCGYKHDRLFQPYIFAGIGANGAFNNDEALALNSAGAEMKNIWDGTKMFVAGRAGLGTGIRLSESIALNLEVNTNILSDKFNSKKAPNSDWQFNALAGITINLGSATKRIAKAAPVAQAAPKPAPKPVAKKQAPVAQKKTAPAAKKEVAKETIYNIFFDINSTTIGNSETAKINNIVNSLKANPSSKIVLTGYADADTGNKNINNRLSEGRANKVKDALVARGIAANRIITNYKGDSVQPFADNDKNRVVIGIIE